MTEESNGRERVQTKPHIQMNASTGFGKAGFLCHQRTGGEQRRQPVLSIEFQASIALCRSIRRRVWGTGGRGGIQQ